MSAWARNVFVLLICSLALMEGAANAATIPDCLQTRVDPALPNGATFLTLPFYQPMVDGNTIDSVVQNRIPPNNHFELHDSWTLNQAAAPIVPALSWRMSEYTGLDTPDVASTQRTHSDQYGFAGTQLVGRQAGFWLNTMDPPNGGGLPVDFDVGSKSTNIGCWYQGEPYAQLFPAIDHVFDVAFDTGVQYDGATGKANAQAYFQFIVKDRSGRCDVDRCTFSVSVSYYAKDPTNGYDENVRADGTGTLSFPLVGTGIDSPHWITRMPDSMGFHTAPFASGPIHFRVSPSQLIQMRDAVAAFPGYENLSTNPLDYGLTLINVNGEVHDPCREVPQSADCTADTHSQLGMTVGGIRATTTVPHDAQGAPFGFNGGTPDIAFRDKDGKLSLFSSDLGPHGFALQTLGDGIADGDPVALYASGSARVFYRDSNHHIHEYFQESAAWISWDMSAYLSAPGAYSDPRAYVGADGKAHVLYRDIVGHVHEFALDVGGWGHRDISALVSSAAPPPAISAPVGYQAGGADRIVYRSANDQVIELYFWNGQWQQWSLTSLPGASTTASDPYGFVDAEGAARVIYRDINGFIHQVKTSAEGWADTNLTTLTGAPPALGSPRGFVAGAAPRIVYRDVDTRLHELVWWNGTWTVSDLGGIDGALKADEDPMGFVGSDQVPRIVYKATDDQLHEFYYINGWLHRDM
jgi:hypothetical protein